MSLFSHSGLADIIDDVDLLDNEKPKPVAAPSPSPSLQSIPINKTRATKESGKKKVEKPVSESSPKMQTDKSRRSPVHIKSDGQLTYARNNGVIHMTQNVVITQDELRFQADEARVWVNEADPENNVEKVECIGNVRVSKFSSDPAEKITARGERAFFYNESRKIILQGDARLWRGGHLIKGTNITYTLDDGMITVDRAEGVVQPEEKKPSPSPSPKK